MRLFVQSAQRHQPAFAAAQHRESIVAICRLLQGCHWPWSWRRPGSEACPVLRSCASWKKVWRCCGPRWVTSKRATATSRRCWSRHGSVSVPRRPAPWRAWRSSAAAFTLEAAETAAEASPYVLADLVENALIRLDEFERYQIHELLRQFAYAQLAAGPELRCRSGRARTVLLSRWSSAASTRYRQPPAGSDRGDPSGNRQCADGLAVGNTTA